MNKKPIRLTEGDLHKIVKESVKKVLKEEFYGDDNHGENGEEYYEDTIEGEYLYDDLMSGKYDDELDDIIRGKRPIFKKWDLIPYAKERKMLIDKQYAMKNADKYDNRYRRTSNDEYLRSKNRFLPVGKVDRKRIPHTSNLNVFDYGTELDKLNKDTWMNGDKRWDF